MSDATGASRDTSPSPARMPTMVEVKLLVTEWMQCSQPVVSTTMKTGAAQ